MHLFSQSRGKLALDDAPAPSCPANGRAGLRLAPAPAAAPSPSPRALADGARRRRRGGRAAAGQSRSVTDAVARRHRRRRLARPDRGKAFVDFQNDVTAKDLALAAREGFRSVEHVKRYTTTGMATDQGKTSNMNALGASSPSARQADARRWA